MDNNNDIFISFSNKDKQIVDPIVETIKYYNISCWYQPDNSQRDFCTNISRAIRESKFFVVFISHNSLTSIRVRNEINSALNKYDNDHSYIILPVIISELNIDDKEEAEVLVSSFNWLFKKNYEDIYSLVLTILAQLNIQGNQRNSQPSIYSGDELIEIDRLNRQNEYLNRVVTPYLDALFSQYNNPLVLDIGCANGQNIKLRLQNRDYNSLLGIDKNDKKIAEANNIYKSEHDEFQVCDIESSQLEHILSNYLKRKKHKGFDIVHIAAVLMHMGNPEKFLKKIYKYVSIGGSIFIQDEDDGFNVIYPHNLFIEGYASSIWKHSKESGDREMGRKIPKLLTDANFTNIKLLTTNISSLDFDGEMKEHLWDMYYNSDLWVVDDSSYFDNKDAYNAYLKYKRKHAELKQRYMNGEFFISIGFVLLSAKKCKS